MKKIAAFAIIATLALSACGTAPGQLSGNKASVGVYAADATSSINVTRNYTPQSVDEKGKVTPEKVEWTVGEAGLVEFTFRTLPGSDAVHITGWRITRYNFNGKELTSSDGVKKINIYVPSGYTCPERDVTQSCQIYTKDGQLRQDVQPAEGLTSAPLKLNFAGGLVSEVKRTLGDAFSTVDIEFTGYSSNGVPVVVSATGITSRAYKLGN